MIGFPEGRNGKIVILKDEPHRCHYPDRHTEDGKKYGNGSVWLCNCGQAWEFRDAWESWGWRQISKRRFKTLVKAEGGM